jgi:ATP-dependent Clp protease adapter protein ClpS
MQSYIFSMTNKNYLLYLFNIIEIMLKSIKYELEKPEGILETDLEVDSDIGTEYRVFLFNDDYHTFEEVINQLIKAINCTFERARAFAFEVHVKGKAMVFSGQMQLCLKVSSILEEINLHTQIVG